jgi:phage terminase large subunit-like protein
MASLSPQERAKFLSDLSEAESEDLEFRWEFWARRNQLAPSGNWSVWLILAGRGFGKTRAGAEWVRDQVCGDTPLTGGKCRHIAIVAETAADARDVMVGDGKGAGEASGLLQVHPKDFMPIYESSKRRLTWPNGAIASIYNATEPEQLRGPQHDGAWCDELAKWRYAQETWDQLEFGLRLGDPRVCITTTPKPIKLLKEILKDPDTVKTTGSTYENAANLSEKFVKKVVRKYEGTRLGRQELEAEILEDVPGALWTRARIEDLRVAPVDVPQLRRVVVAIDPAATSGEDADETGIICAGLGADGHGYVLEDSSGHYKPYELDEHGKPTGWAAEAIALFKARKADRIVAEINNGGEMVESTIRVVNANVAYKGVHASRGKAIRAEPVSALYEQGKVHHVGAFALLEDQMCAFTSDFDRKTAGYSPDRMDALVWALTELMVGETNSGIIQFYEGQAAEAAKKPADAHGFTLSGGSKVAGEVKMKAPAGISTIFGLSGKQYSVDASGHAVVATDDAPSLRQAGFLDAEVAV